jgi:2-polyprenyl-3-methyl-5-hydroxy-6-metoxy-1,4-benzoquinol methylase
MDPVMPADPRQASYTTVRSDVVDAVPLHALSVLDVGCSNGAAGRALKAMQPGRSVCGIEFDAQFAREAGEHLDHVIHADLNVMDWQVALGQRQFDCMIFADVLEHLADPQRCMTQALRHLQPGGCVVVSLPNVRHLSALLSIYGRGRFPQRDRGIFDRTHLRWFTIADAHAFLARNSLAVTASWYALRWGDQGGGRGNRWLNRLPAPVQRWAPVREFLTYQVCLKAVRA